MKRLLSIFAFFASFWVHAQSLTVHSMDSVAYVNSHTGSLAEAHIALLNTSASTQSYLIKRMQIGTTGLVDSNYFCWDLCYPTWVNQSQGSVQVNAGSVAYDFSGYAYVMDTSANGQDTVWYRFENVADSTDFLDVQVVYAFSTTFGQTEASPAAARIYPNPSATGRVTLEFAPSSLGGYIEVMDVLGQLHARIPVAPYQTSATWMSHSAPKGVYLLRRNLGQRPETMGKVLIQ
jgi:hypothetical protein